MKPMEKYRFIEEEGWKLLWRDCPEYKHGEAPIAKVISFFTKSSPKKIGDVDQVIKPPPEINYDKVRYVRDVDDALTKTLNRKKKFYGDQDLYKYIALQDYVNQCKMGGYDKCLLSWQEISMITPKTK